MSSRNFVPVNSWADERQLLGIKGERWAIAFLTSCGWSIEAHRFRMGRHEIDLVIRQGHLVAFVEVKTRRSLIYGSGLEAVNRPKQHHICRVASAWVARYGRADDEYRFDVVALQGSGARGAPTIEHVADAWRAGGRWF
jgi:putative endonuclease